MKMFSDMYTWLIEIILHLKRKTWNRTLKQQQANALTTYCEAIRGIMRGIRGVLYESWGYNPPEGCRKLPGREAAFSQCARASRILIRHWTWGRPPYVVTPLNTNIGTDDYILVIGMSHKVYQFRQSVVVVIAVDFCPAFPVLYFWFTIVGFPIFHRIHRSHQCIQHRWH